jgi:hypothetical protein
MTKKMELYLLTDLSPVRAENKALRQPGAAPFSGFVSWKTLSMDLKDLARAILY